MLLLLPPSETKRPGGAPDSSLDLSALSLPRLTPIRRALIDEVRALSSDPAAAAAALKLGPRQEAEIERNRALLTSPTMPALERYTGVLYDALDAPSLSAGSRSAATRVVWICSALFGLIGAADPIPAYRLSAGSRLPGRPLIPLWRGALTEVLAERCGLLVDMRSAAYASLAPLPERADAVTLRVVSERPDGRRTVLSHVNKSAKGRFARRVLDSGVEHADLRSLLDWGESEGIRLERVGERGLDLVV